MLKTIPNSLNLAVFCAFFPVAWFAGLSLSSMGWHAACGIAAMIVALMFGYGGGAGKLFGAISTWIGPSIELAVFTIVSCLTLVAVSYLIAAVRREQAESLPYAPFALIGFAVVFASTPLAEGLANQLH